MPSHVPLTHALSLIGLLDTDAKSAADEVAVDQDSTKREFFVRAFEGRLVIEGICEGVWSTVPNKWDSLLLRHGQCEAIELGDRRWTDLRVDREQLIAVWPQLSGLSPAVWDGDGAPDAEATSLLWHCLHCFAYTRPTESCPRCGLMFTVDGKDYEVERDEGGWEVTTLDEILAPPHRHRFVPGFDRAKPEGLPSSIAGVLAAVRSGKGRRRIEEIPKKMGRPQQYDWEAMYVEIIRFANGPDGLPDKQADLIKHLQTWFQSKFGKEPSDSSIKERVRAVYRAIGAP